MGFFSDFVTGFVKEIVSETVENKRSTQNNRYPSIYYEAIQEFREMSNEELVRILYGLYLREIHNAENAIVNPAEMIWGQRAIRDILISREGVSDDELDYILAKQYEEDRMGGRLDNYSY
ncbi:hypothetical protein EDC51_10967 [Bibersteinia trehalosi]|uniref:hypothetical protein n=1 Tax=Bibersteinia trehalosi TaxID=47735 RepID=UPI0010442357|nr:hypothetical protein [Bibersteinia trehalosi]TCT14179.1 hypothetical protein EDC51_10967 [Bibersteinia trehalosi]